MPFLLLRIARFLAAGLLLVSLLLPWFRVPYSVVENLNGGYSAVYQEAASTAVFKAFVLGVLFTASWIGFRRRHAGPVASATPIAVGGCLVLVALGVAY